MNKTNIQYHFYREMKHSFFSAERKTAVITTGLTASVFLYLLMVCVAEPARSFAATSANTIVSLEIVSTSSLTCSPTVSITSSTGAIPTGTSTYGTGGTMATCVAISNNALGYTLKWLISSGSGGRTGTGHLNSNNVTGGQPDRILSYKPAVTDTPEAYAAPNGVNPSSTSRWAARVKSSSTTNSGVAGKDWGTDLSTEKFLNIGTGAVVSLVKRTNATSLAGDLEYVQFKANLGSTSAQPTGTYKATVTLYLIDN